MSLRNNIIPLVLVTGCGIFTAVSTFQPELKKQTEGPLEDSTNSSLSTTSQQDNAISAAIKEDLQAARKELAIPKGFAWGIRQALFGEADGGTEEHGQQAKDESLRSR